MANFVVARSTFLKFSNFLGEPLQKFSFTIFSFFLPHFRIFPVLFYTLGIFTLQLYDHCVGLFSRGLSEIDASKACTDSPLVFYNTCCILRLVLNPYPFTLRTSIKYIINWWYSPQIFFEDIELGRSFNIKPIFNLYLDITSN